MNPSRCDTCGESFSDSSLYASHRCLTRQTPPPSGRELEKFKCSQCSHVFAEPSPLKCHFETHHMERGPEAPFHCSEQSCEFRTGDHKEYQSHLTAMHGLTLIPCNFQSCKESFRTQGEMESHKKGHMPFGCFHCQFVAQNEKELSDHLQEHNTQQANSQGTETTAGSHLSRRKKRKNSSSTHDDKNEKAADGQERTIKRARRTVGGDKSSAVDVDAAAQASKEYLAEGAEHIYRTHTCPKCRRCFKMRSHLQEHLHLHDPDPSLQCPTCERYFTSKSKLRIHRLREAGEKLHQCHLCGYSAVERNAIRRHLVTVHSDEAGDGADCQSYPCPTCGLRFRQSRLLKAHMKSHNVLPDGKPVGCFQEGCAFQSSLRKAILKHAAEVHGVKAVECRHHACGAIFAGEKEMESHYRTHLAYHCSQCDFSSSNKTAFLQHQRLGHSGINKLCCDFCTFFTFNPVEFDQHIGHLHASEKIHRCSQCSYVTSHKRGLKRHMLMHSDEKPHKCNLCEFRCRDESYLSKHMLTHSSDKNFMCAECGYVTKWKHYLNVHMRKHAGDLRYQCDQCPYRCHRMDQLNSHKLRHQAKTLICEVCAYACKRKYELHNHMLAKHSGDGKQPSVLKCKYCAYTTCYRQALQNHENCKHTKLKEFRCALCFYSSFSSISLFLHKRKAHGYVPGDKAWLENYAAKEKERNSTEILRDFYRKPTVGNKPSGEPPPAAHRKQSNLHDSANHSKGAGEAPQAASSPTLLDVACQEVVRGGMSDTPLSGNSPEYCTLVLTTLSSGDYEAPSSRSEGGANPPAAFFSPEEVARKECEESDRDDRCDSRDGENEQVGPEKGQSKTPELEKDSGTVISAPPPEQNRSEIRLRALRKHDRDQAEAMVLEGRVQMLVVPTKDVYHCDKCSYVTRKEAAFKYHCRSLCLGQAQGHKCQCGALFKQRRGLDGHLAKKCPAVPRKTRTLSAPRSVLEENGSKQLGGGTNPDQTRSLSDQDLHEEEGGSSELSGRPTENGKETHVSPTKAALYAEQDGRFKCKLCNFSAVRLATVNRHVSNCQKSRGKEGSLTLSEDADEPGDTSKKGKTPAVEKIGSAASEKGQTFSCPRCAFKCSQRRVLDCHEKRGCQTSSENQCATCSFVAPSIRSLDRHILQAHGGKKPGPAKPKQFQCKSCAFTCKQERRLARHVALKHGGERPHRCRYCPYGTARRYRLEQHESLHMGLGRRRCHLCDKTFGTANKLRQHETRVHEGRPSHPCPLCDFGGYTPDDVRRHRLRCHTGELRHACAHCEASFSSEAALRNHRRRVHRLQALFSCERCGFSCTSEVTLKSHRETEHREVGLAVRHKVFEAEEDLEAHGKTHRCHLCPYAARTRQLLARHLLGEHEGGPPQDKPLKCSSCPFACRHQLVLEQHLRSHGGSRLYKCTDCEYSTRNKQKITWHIRIHTGEKPYSCEQCSYTCADPTRLKLHMRVHQEEKKYLCPECGYKCKWATQLKYHMTKHTGERAYACDQCDYRTNRADALRAHRDTQHCDVRAYVCEKCGKAFKTSFILKTHQRQHSDGRPYACGLCHKAFRWPAGLRHHYLSHTKQQPFRCRHCPYRAKQKFQVVKHLRRHHPEVPAEQGVARDSGAAGLTLKEAMQGRLGERAAEEEGEEGGHDDEVAEREEASKTH